MDRMVLQLQVFSMYRMYPMASADICGRGEITGTNQSLCEEEMVIEQSAWACRDYCLLVFIADKYS